MNRRVFGLATAAATALLASQAAAQPSDFPIPPAQSTQFPAGISIKKTALGNVYVDAKGRILYGMDTRAVVNRTTDRVNYCTGPCLAIWEPVAPPPGTPSGRVQGQAGVNGNIPQGQQGGVVNPQPAAAAGAAVGRGGQAPGGQAGAAATLNPQAAVARGGGGRGGTAGPAQPDWIAVETANGPQLAYKGVHMAFVRKDDPTSVKWDGQDDLIWNTLKYVPPVPKLVAPATVMPVYIDGAYAMVDKDQRVLYTCATACAKGVPFTSGFVIQGLGEWTVLRSGDSPQWMYKGRPVYVSQGTPKTSKQLPAGAAMLRP